MNTFVLNCSTISTYIIGILNGTSMHQLHTNKKLYLAPMVGYSNTYFREFARFLSKDVVLFTEMAKALKKPSNLLPDELQFTRQQLPLVAQIGGNDPITLTDWAKYLSDKGFSEINLNVGCPGITTTKMGYGACLLRNPDHVAKIFYHMAQAATIPVSIKTRIGLNHETDYKFLYKFISKLYQSGCSIFYIHARHAILDTITSHQQNRTVPPINYNIVKKLKSDFSQCTFIVNGQINTLHQIINMSSNFDGVMIGRASYNQWELLLNFDNIINLKTLSNHSKPVGIYNYFKSYLYETFGASCYTSNVLKYINNYLNKQSKDIC